jgi:hypothetical protein
VNRMRRGAEAQEITVPMGNSLSAHGGNNVKILFARLSHCWRRCPSWFASSGVEKGCEAVGLASRGDSRDSWERGAELSAIDTHESQVDRPG